MTLDIEDVYLIMYTVYFEMYDKNMNCYYNQEESEKEKKNWIRTMLSYVLISDKYIKPLKL